MAGLRARDGADRIELFTRGLARLGGFAGSGLLRRRSGLRVSLIRDFRGVGGSLLPGFRGSLRPWGRGGGRRLHSRPQGLAPARIRTPKPPDRKSSPFRSRAAGSTQVAIAAFGRRPRSCQGPPLPRMPRRSTPCAARSVLGAHQESQNFPLIVPIRDAKQIYALTV